MANNIDAIFEAKWKELAKPIDRFESGILVLNKEEARKMFQWITWHSTINSAKEKPGNQETFAEGVTV